MLRGTFTALITPFNSDGSIDEKTFRDLIKDQIKNGITGIVPCGTTGESPTLSYKDHDRLIEIAVDEAKGKVHIMAGTGSNSTEEAIEMTKFAKKVGADSSLQVVPYYNKPTQEGLFRHFKTIAEKTKIPIIIYNIQGRTGINLETATLVELAKIDNIIGVKEASGSITQMMDVIKNTRNIKKDFSVLSGDDRLTLPLMSIGGDGVISVASNVIPKKMVDFVNLGLNKDFDKMKEGHYYLDELFVKLFIETNPIPVKTILFLKDKIKKFFRLPMCEASSNTISVMKDLINKYGI